MNNIFEALQQIDDPAWSERTIDEFVEGDMVRNIVKLDGGGVRVVEGRVTTHDGERLISEAGITLGTVRSSTLHGASDAPRLNEYTDQWNGLDDVDLDDLRGSVVRKVFFTHDGTMEAIFDVGQRERFTSLINKNGNTIVTSNERSAKNVTVHYASKA